MDKELLKHANKVTDMIVKEIRRSRRMKEKQFRKCCPICSYTFDRCQCRYGGSGHPDRSKEREVVFDHLYLLSKKQLKHAIELQKFWQISYGDKERSDILEKLKGATRNA